MLYRTNNMGIFPLIINGGDLVPDDNNNRYRYMFPSGSAYFRNAKIAVGNISMYYSWFNITSTYGNNTFSFKWDGTLTVLHTVTLSDGFYDVAALNSYLQDYCVSNNLYLINSDGDYVYYLEFVENPTYYSVQLNSYPIPTSLPSGWSAPGSWPGYPATASTPQLVVASNAFRDIIGFNAGTYPTVAQTTTYSKISDYTPQVSPVQSVVVLCSLLNNRYANPDTVLYSFNPAGVSFGGLISSVPSEAIYTPVQQGSYNEITIEFIDQNFNALKVNDTNLIITLLIDSGEDDF